MLTFLSGFACGTLAAVVFVAAFYFMVDRATRPPNGG